MRVKLKIAYDGSDYIGWQKQPSHHGKSVEGVLSKALSVLLREEIILCASGRTDAGVHALGQVAHFNTQKPLPPENIPRAVNRLLPESIRILEAQKTDEDFHARKSALLKTYRYTLSMAKNARDIIFGGRYFWPLGKELDLEAMAAASEYILGEHDFIYFSVTGRPVISSLRNISKLKIFTPQEQGFFPWQQIPEPLCLEITANGFLYKMVRLITARLVEVGLHKLEPGDIQRLLKGESFPAAAPAPARGLMLINVKYPEN